MLDSVAILTDAKHKLLASRALGATARPLAEAVNQTEIHHLISDPTPHNCDALATETATSTAALLRRFYLATLRQ